MIRSKFRSPPIRRGCCEWLLGNQSRCIVSKTSQKLVPKVAQGPVMQPCQVLQRSYRTAPWMSPSPFASTDRRKDGLELLNYQDCLVWIDCEMTGLESHDALLELAMVITDNSLSVLMEGLDIVIYQPEHVLNDMLPEVRDMHTKTGLLDRVRDSIVTVEEADWKINEYMNRLLNDTELYFMAGSSVHIDKKVIGKYLPQTAARFSHRIVDVTTMMELVRRWMPHTVDGIDAKRLRGQHKAMDDILASISVLRLLRESAFKDSFKH